MAQINVKAVLDSKAFSSAIDRMESKVQGFSTKIGSIKSTLSAAFAVGGIMRMVGAAAKAADEIDNLAQQTDLSVEALQALRVMADEAGISFDTMRPTINFLRRAIASALSGNDKLIESFSKLGITFGELKSLRTEQILNLVAKRMAESGGSAETNAEAVKVLGAESTRLNNLLIQLGDEGLQNVIDRMTEMGQISSKEVIQSLDRFEESSSRLGRRLGTLGTNIAGFSMMSLEALGTALGALTAGGSIEDVRKLLAEIRYGTEEAADGVEGLAESFSDLEEEAKAAKKEVEDAMNLFKDQGDYVQLLIDREYELMTAEEKLIEMQKRRAALQETLNNLPDENIKKRIEYTKKLYDAEDEIKSIEEKMIQDGKEFIGMFASLGKNLIRPFMGDGENAVTSSMAMQRPLDALGRHGAGGASGPNPVMETNRLARRQVTILERVHQTLERISNKEAGGAIL